MRRSVKIPATRSVRGGPWPKLTVTADPVCQPCWAACAADTNSRLPCRVPSRPLRTPKSAILAAGPGSMPAMRAGTPATCASGSSTPMTAATPGWVATARASPGSMLPCRYRPAWLVAVMAWFAEAADAAIMLTTAALVGSPTAWHSGLALPHARRHFRQLLRRRRDPPAGTPRTGNRKLGARGLPGRRLGARLHRRRHPDLPAHGPEPGDPGAGGAGRDRQPRRAERGPGQPALRRTHRASGGYQRPWQPGARPRRGCAANRRG